MQSLTPTLLGRYLGLLATCWHSGTGSFGSERRDRTKRPVLVCSSVIVLLLVCWLIAGLCCCLVCVRSGFVACIAQVKPQDQQS